jgi:hypothetical protein
MRGAGIAGEKIGGLPMRKTSLLLAVLLAASFSTVADAAKKKAGAPVDAAYQWNVEHMKPMAAGAADSGKKMKHHRHHGKKMAKKMGKKKS